MRTLSLLLVVVMILVAPSLASALSLTVSATVSNGTNLGTHTVLECTGYNYNDNGDPWAQCSNKGQALALSFGNLSTRLLDAGGGDAGGAGCFYAPKFFIVYLYPDAWGGKGYDLKQTAASIPAAIANSVVMTPVYSKDDKYSGATSGQGDLNTGGYTGEVVGSAVLAKNGGPILKARRPRIVRAQYSIPPYPATGLPNPTSDPAWTPVPLTTAATTYTSGSITISITEW